MDLNTTGFTGKVISVQELRYVGDNAKAVLKFRFRVYQGKFKGEHKSIFLDGECWGPHAEFLANTVVLAKDMRVGVSGRLDMDEYDANDGSGKRQAWKVANAQVTVLDQAGGAGSAKNDDDVPF